MWGNLVLVFKAKTLNSQSHNVLVEEHLKMSRLCLYTSTEKHTDKPYNGMGARTVVQLKEWGSLACEMRTTDRMEEWTAIRQLIFLKIGERECISFLTYMYLYKNGASWSGLWVCKSKILIQYVKQHEKMVIKCTHSHGVIPSKTFSKMIKNLHCIALHRPRTLSKNLNFTFYPCHGISNNKEKANLCIATDKTK
jgi:hypothetical protein